MVNKWLANRWDQISLIDTHFCIFSSQLPTLWHWEESEFPDIRLLGFPLWKRMCVCPFPNITVLSPPSSKRNRLQIIRQRHSFDLFPEAILRSSTRSWSYLVAPLTALHRPCNHTASALQPHLQSYAYPKGRQWRCMKPLIPDTKCCSLA